jgi:hypothetical protein
MLDLKNKNIDSQVLIGAIICCSYFAMLSYVRRAKIDTILDGSLGDIVAIPFLFLSIAILVAAVYFLAINKQGRPLFYIVSLALLLLAGVFYFN